MNNVDLNIAGGIGTITFSSERSNALPGQILKKLAETVQVAGEMPEIKVIVLKSAGDRAFCAGASFDELMAIDNEQEGKEFFMGFARVINAMRKAPKFIIGRVQGKAVGGGIGLAASTDYCLATPFASIKLSELALGIGPFVVGPAIERKMGLSAMSQMGMNAGEFYDAEWALQKGLFTEIKEDVLQLDAAVEEMAQKLSQYNPDAMVALKRAFWEGTDHWDTLLAERAAVSGRLVLSSFTKSFIKKFKST
jgi:methylglutaconyl-CoA hydratase